MTTRRLIDLHLSGKSVGHLVDGILEELPPLSSIRQTLLRALPGGSAVRIDEDLNALLVSTPDCRAAAEQIDYFSRTYPEIDFAITNDDNQ